MSAARKASVGFDAWRRSCHRWLAAGVISASLVLLAGCHKAGPAPVPTTALMAIDTPPPAYPAELACDDVGGQVLLRLTIGTDGRPTTVQTLQKSREPALDAAALDAVRTWRFEPATRGGQPVSTQLNVPVTFTPPQVRPASCFVLDEQRKAAR